MRSSVIGNIKSVAVAFADMVVKLDLLVVEGCRFDFIIGDPAMEDLEGVIDIGKRTVSLNRGEKRFH